METKNLKRLMVLFGVLFLLLAGRLAYIQILGHEDLSAATKAQCLISLEGSNTRGVIYDRNGAALVANQKHYIYIMKEEAFDGRAAALLRKTGAKEVSSDNEGYAVYFSKHYDKAAGKALIDDCGAYILQASSRYGERQTAAHLIGYVNQGDNSGAAGLELMYDKELSGLNRRIYAVADVKGNLLTGRGLIIASEDEKDSYIRDGIRTTIDKELQEAVERIIARSGNDCAVAVLDVKSGGVAAMACTPGFDPNNITRHLESDGDELINKVTQGEYAPGSIFKIVVACAALEAGIDVTKTYMCQGDVTVGGLSIGCETGGETGHGAIGMTEAFAASCNSYFVQLGQALGADRIIETAQKLGLGEKVLEGFPQESGGHLMTEYERMGDAVGNLSIGQGETLVTPLQAAAMTNVIAGGGMDKGIHLLMGEKEGTEQVISGYTAEQVRRLMEGVSAFGTASGLGLVNESGRPEAAVKTGTAEYGSGEDGRAHGWITGFAPCEAPEYTITVLVEDGASGAGSAGPVFRQILEYLQESGSFSLPTLA